MQKIMCIGNLTRDPEIRLTNNGTQVVNFRIAVNSMQKDKNGERITDFFECTSWGKLAETIYKFCKKGKKICVVGEIHNETYVATQDGSIRYVSRITVRECEFLDYKNDNDENQETTIANPKIDEPKIDEVNIDKNNGNMTTPIVETQNITNTKVENQNLEIDDKDLPF